MPEEKTEQTVDELLESVKGKYDACIVTGFDSNGHLFMFSSVSNIPFIHWTLTRSIFELGLFEKQYAHTEDGKTPVSVDTEASEA